MSTQTGAQNASSDDILRAFVKAQSGDSVTITAPCEIVDEMGITPGEQLIVKMKRGEDSFEVQRAADAFDS